MVFTPNSTVNACSDQSVALRGNVVGYLEMCDPCQHVREEHPILSLQMGFLERTSTFYIWDIYTTRD